MNKTKLPYGQWSSPITPAMLGAGKRLNDVQWIPGGDGLVWSESYSGKTSLWVKFPNEAAEELSGDHNLSGGIGYGGGDFAAGREGAIFSDKDGRLYFKSYGPGAPRAITPGFGACGAPAISPNGKWVVYVHTYEGKDVLALQDLKGESWPVIIASGADFYMDPQWSADSSLIAWVEWNHPHMPWESSQLHVSRFDPAAKSLNKVVFSSPASHLAVGSAVFSPLGSRLAYLANDTDKDSLIVVDLTSGEMMTPIQDRLLLNPAWVQGMCSLQWSADAESLWYIENLHGNSQICRVDLQGETAVRPLTLNEYDTYQQLTVSKNGKLSFIAQSFDRSPRIMVWHEGEYELIARSRSEVVEGAYYAKPQSISWVSSDGAQVYGLFYPPQHKTYTADGLPPVIVTIHGGPTSQVINAYNPEAAYFTSRGYAYFAVNYRGSSGYGRAYIEALNGKWGQLDTQDAKEGSQYLVDKGLVDPAKIVIKGGSAGGYTVLNSLIRHPGFYKAGICSYGVSNLFLLEMETHKFESHYTASLVGTLPEAAEKYQAWSPAFHADKICDPLAVFQGSEDKVVPPNQSETIVTQLRANRVPHVYRLYEGEGHGFRKAETLQDYYQTVEQFLREKVIFS